MNADADMNLPGFALFRVAGAKLGLNTLRAGRLSCWILLAVNWYEPITRGSIPALHNGAP